MRSVTSSFDGESETMLIAELDDSEKNERKAREMSLRGRGGTGWN